MIEGRRDLEPCWGRWGVDLRAELEIELFFSLFLPTRRQSFRARSWPTS